MNGRLESNIHCRLSWIILLHRKERSFVLCSINLFVVLWDILPAYASKVFEVIHYSTAMWMCIGNRPFCNRSQENSYNTLIYLKEYPFFCNHWSSLVKNVLRRILWFVACIYQRMLFLVWYINTTFEWIVELVIWNQSCVLRIYTHHWMKDGWMMPHV